MTARLAPTPRSEALEAGQRRVGAAGSAGTTSGGTRSRPPVTHCQMDTFFRLGWGRTHNTIHSGEVTQMLQATPQCLGARLIAATASHKTAELCNPTHRLRQRWGLCRRRGTVMDGTIQRLP